MHYMMKWLAALLLCFAMTVNAGTASQYQIDVPLESNALSAQEKAFREGFNALLQKTALADPEDLKVTNEQIMQTVLQFQVHDESGQSQLSINFDKQAINDLLKDLGVSLEQSKKKQWVTWVATQHGETHQLLGGSPLPFELALLSDLAERVDVGLIIPELDLEDLDALSFDDVWLDHKSRWMKASDRYRADGVLVIKLLKNSAGSWHATWSLTTDKEDLHLEGDDASLTSLFENGIEELKKRLETVENSIEAEELYIEVADVHSSDSYQTILSFLRTLRGVEQAELDGVTPDKVLYKLTVTVSRSTLERQISQNHFLIAEDKPEDKVLYYRLNS